jgi:hypothetical protein
MSTNITKDQLEFYRNLLKNSNLLAQSSKKAPSFKEKASKLMDYIEKRIESGKVHIIYIVRKNYTIEYGTYENYLKKEKLSFEILNDNDFKNICLLLKERFGVNLVEKINIIPGYGATIEMDIRGVKINIESNNISDRIWFLNEYIESSHIDSKLMKAI